MLLALDAAVRKGSFSGAACELNLTSGAVSRQVSALEKQLGLVLFVRNGRGIRPTAVGTSYASEVRPILSALRNASLAALGNPMRRTLNLAVLPTFGTRWLMPRFPTFLEDHPDVTVSFVTKTTQFDFNTERVDAAIHFGVPDWPGAHCTYLMGEDVVPACAPQLVAGSTYLSLEHIRDLPLLHLESRLDSWKAWFSANNLVLPNVQKGILFEQFSLAIQAAVAGLGVALLPKFLIKKEIECGELVSLSKGSIKTDTGYYLVTPQERADVPPVVQFREWLLLTIKHDEYRRKSAT